MLNIITENRLVATWCREGGGVAGARQLNIIITLSRPPDYESESSFIALYKSDTITAG